MTETYFRELVVLAGSGIGLLTFGTILVFVGLERRGLTTGGLIVGTAGAGFGAAFVLDPTAGWTVAALTAGVAAGFLTLGSDWLTTALQLCRRPAVRVGGLAALGVTLLIGGIIRYDVRSQAEAAADIDWMTRVTEQPPTREITTVVTTDQGNRIRPREAVRPRPAEELRALAAEMLGHLPQAGGSLRQGPASDDCNCHGWVFTGGRYWLGADDVQAILDENGYAAVTDPRPDDVAIYRQGNAILHTAVVRAVGDRIPVLVEGKWGWMGVYLHPIDATCYGKSVTYFRSSREGHLLVGLGGRASGEARTEGGQ